MADGTIVPSNEQDHNAVNVPERILNPSTADVGLARNWVQRQKATEWKSERTARFKYC